MIITAINIIIERIEIPIVIIVRARCLVSWKKNLDKKIPIQRPNAVLNNIRKNEIKKAGMAISNGERVKIATNPAVKVHRKGAVNTNSAKKDPISKSRFLTGVETRASIIPPSGVNLPIGTEIGIKNAVKVFIKTARKKVSTLFSSEF